MTTQQHTKGMLDSSPVWLKQNLLSQDKQVFLLLICCLGSLYWLVVRPLWHGRLSHVPGPWLNKITQLHLAFYDLTWYRNDQIRKWHQQYGPVVCISPNEVSVSTLEATRQVYGSSNRWAKSGYFDNFIGFNERSIFAAKTHYEHREKRKLTSTFYQASNIHTVAAIQQRIRDRSQAMIQQIKPEEEVDVYSLTDRYALDNITYLVLGPQHCTQSIEMPGTECEILEELKHLQFFGPFRARYPTFFKHMAYVLNTLSLRHSYLLADGKLAEWCLRRITAAVKEESGLGPHCLLHRLLHDVQPGSTQKLSDNYIAAEVLDNINAAEATVAVTATYLIWQLTENPKWQQKLQEELCTLSTQADGFFASNDIYQAPILEACLREVYRLHPASSGRAERVVPEGGYTLSGVHLPQDTIVTTSIVALHRDEILYPHPDRFMPERWLVGDEATLKERDAHLIPFGYGARICLGKALAIMEIKILVADLYLRFESHLTPSCTAESMRQCSTHDAVPRDVKCMIRFRELDREI